MTYPGFDFVFQISKVASALFDVSNLLLKSRNSLFESFKLSLCNVAVGNLCSEVVDCFVQLLLQLLFCSFEIALELLDKLHQSKVFTLQYGILVIVSVLAGCERAHGASQRGADEHSANDFLHLESEY